MASTEAKLAFKNKVFRLAGLRDQEDAENESSVDSSGEWSDPVSYIPTQDPYWEMFWNEPEAADDIYNLLSFNDIKFIRDSNKVNFLNWVRILTTRLIKIAVSRQFPDNSDASPRKLLNCVRFLNKVLPFLFEKDDLNNDANNIFWNLNYNNIGLSHHQLSAASNATTVGTFPSSSDLDSSLSSSSLKVNIPQINQRPPGSARVNINTDENTETLGQQLVSTLVNLLFARGFTLDLLDNVKGVDFKIWEVGIGANGKYSTPDPGLDSNRLEVLRLLITLSSNGLYSTPKEVVQNGSRFLSVLVATIPRLKLLTFLCSLLNTTCRSCKLDTENNGLTYNSAANHNQYSSQKYYVLRRTTVTYSIQLLSIMLVYPLPTNDIAFLHSLNIIPNNEKPHNLARSYLGRLHKETELNFIYQSLFSLITRPVEQAIENEASPFNLIKTNFSQSPTSTSSAGSNNGSFGNAFPGLSSWSIEIFVLLWELIQCNKNFKQFVFTKKSPELLVVLLYHIRFYKNHELWKSNLIRILCYLTLNLTSDEAVLNQLLQPFSQTYYTSKIPNFYKLGPNAPSNFTYRDFIIIQISNMLTNDEFDQIITPNLFEYLYNLIPVKASDIKTKTILSYHSCLAILNVIIKFSTKDVLQDQLKMDLLALTIRSIANSICRYHIESRTLLFVLAKHEKIFIDLLSLVETSSFEYELDNIKEVNESEEEETGLHKLNTSSSTINAPGTGTVTPIEEEEPAPNDIDNDDIGVLSKEDTEKILRPRLPVGMSSKAKSKLPINAPLVKVWAGYRALVVILEAIKLVKEELPDFQNLRKSETIEALIKIENIKGFHRRLSKYSPSEFLPKLKFEQLRFNWSNLSLGWYESILWGSIFYENLNSTKNSNTSNWFNKRNSAISLKEVASSWGFNWKSSSHSKQTPVEMIQFDNSVLRLSIWNGTSIKLFKIKKSVADKPLVDVTTLMKRFRLNSTSSLNTIDSRSSLGSPVRQNSQSGFNSPNQLTPINSRQSFGTPRNSVHLNISRQNSQQ